MNLKTDKTGFVLCNVRNILKERKSYIVTSNDRLGEKEKSLKGRVGRHSRGGVGPPFVGKGKERKNQEFFFGGAETQRIARRGDSELVSTDCLQKVTEAECKRSRLLMELKKGAQKRGKIGKKG